MRVAGLGKALGSAVIDNHMLGERFDVDADWIKRRSGIVERRCLAPQETLLDLASRAAKQALEFSSIKATDLCAIVVATATAKLPCPTLSAKLGEALLPAGAHEIVMYDLNAACTGFASALLSVAHVVESSKKPALIIGAEAMSRILDVSDIGTAILFSDGAGAMVVVPDNTYPVWTAESMPSEIDALICDPQDDGSYLVMDGARVYNFAVSELTKLIENLLDKTSLQAGEQAKIIMHQANARIVNSVAKRLYKGANASKIQRVVDGIAFSGNTSAASIPILLAEMQEKGELHSGDLLILAACGAGLTGTGLTIRIA